MDHLPQLLRIINQVFELEKKAGRSSEAAALSRHTARIWQAFEEMDLRIHNPAGEPYNELRTDCEASLAGRADKPLTITEVLKPMVFQEKEGRRILVQKAVIIADN